MKYLSLITLITLFSFSCNKNSSENPCEEPDLDCTGIRCAAFHSIFEFRLVNLAGNDPVFGSNPVYNTSEIKLFEDESRTKPINLNADPGRKSFITLNGLRDMYLEIGGTDVYKLSATYRTKDCCTNQLKTLSVDGQMVCTCCTDITPVTIR